MTTSLLTLTIAKTIAYAGRAANDQSTGVEDFWNHTGEETRNHHLKCAEALTYLFQTNTNNIASKEFNRGYVIAVCNIVNLHGETTIAEDVLQQLNITESELIPMDLSEYDQAAIDNIKKNGRGCAFKSE